MNNYEFTIVASGFDPRNDEFMDRLSEAGCDDATVSWQNGVAILDFDRDAPSFSSAIISALEGVTQAGGKVERIEPDHLVSAADIAERSGLSRSAVTLYHKGERCTDFPVPRIRVTSTSPLWDWQEVAAWLYRQGKLKKAEVVRARLVKEANQFLEAKDQCRGTLLEHLEKAELVTG